MSGPSPAPLDVDGAGRRIAPWVSRTPLVALGDGGIRLKAESLQPTGSFKVRGAFNSILQLDPARRDRGVVAHSSGNHAQAVAYASACLGVAATIVMPDDAPEVKVARTRDAGATVVLVGPASRERTERAAAIAEDEGRVVVEPYDSDAVLAATATIALEILDDTPADQALELYVPISGGGLAGGVAVGAKASGRDVRVVGVEPELAADARDSLARDERVEWPAAAVSRTIADGLRVQRVGARPWPHLRAHVDEVVTVTEAEICAAMVSIATDARLVAEPSGATAAAAAMVGRGGAGAPPAQRVAVLSGGNVDRSLYAQVLSGWLPPSPG